MDFIAPLQVQRLALVREERNPAYFMPFLLCRRQLLTPAAAQRCCKLRLGVSGWGSESARRRAKGKGDWCEGAPGARELPEGGERGARLGVKGRVVPQCSRSKQPQF